MWGAGRGLQNLVLALVAALIALFLILCTVLIDRAYEWHMRDEPRPLPRDLPAVVAPARMTGNPAASFGPDFYPAEAVRQGWEGRSRVAVLVDEAGTPMGCEVVETSRHAILDRATCRMVVRHVHFKPALGLQGRPVRSIYRTFNVRWRLPTDSK